jgi:hypothetical protein
MRRDDLADSLCERTDGPDAFPAYEDYCVANVPDAALGALDADAGRPVPGAFDGVETDVDHVLVVVADGLGWDAFRALQSDVPLLSALAADGTVTPLTSVYPSETAAALTTVHTGAQPVEHGLLGWYGLLDGEVIRTLPFETLDGRPLDAARPGTDADDLLEAGETAYERAADEGLAARVVQPEEVRGSVYSERVTRGAAVAGYASERDFAAELRKTVTDADHPTYALAYAADADRAAHRAGTDSPEYRKALGRVCGALRRAVRDLPRGAAERTLVVLTADHGHVNTDPEANVALGSDLTEHLEAPVVGGPRNLQFHTREGGHRAVERVLERFDAATFTREAARERDLFGDRERGGLFRRREPDLTCAPREVSMWYDGEELDAIGMHGGLAPGEMLVPFAACRAAELEV